MNYKETQRKKAVDLRSEIFCDPGGGMYDGKPRDFVLANPELNLWAGIREDAQEYYNYNKICWWGSAAKPTGHLLSSQVACLNHLYFLRQRRDLATAVLNQIDSKFINVDIIDDGFVEFEKTGKQQLGNERHLTRGANCTSIDAMMLAEDVYGSKTIVLIEWKYTESYDNSSKADGTSGLVRLDAYKDLLDDINCPIICKNKSDLYYEPFYQMMRQTLLGWQMVKHGEYNAKNWIHLHIIPNDNHQLKDKITSPGLTGSNVEDSWKSILKQPDKYIVKSPEEFLSPLVKCKDTKAILSYLQKRYW